MAETLIDALRLLVVIVGFGLVIVIHELGHFLAAKWAGIRVHEFAVGFGPAIGSWRKGLGFRRGSSLREYDRLAAEGRAERVSPTEYRLNWLPLGGYVKMLGQEDIAPAAEVAAPDSYQTKPVWKRMVVVSAGVVMNLILAAALFIAVFMIGLRSPSTVIGAVDPDSAAAAAVAVGRPEMDAGLRAGDEVVRIGDRRARSFRDVSLAAAMAEKGAPVEIVVRRPGLEGEIKFVATPRVSERTRLLELGLWAAQSNLLADPPASDPTRGAVERILRDAGLERVPLGSRLVEVGGAPVEYAWALTEACAASRGAPVEAVFESPSGERIRASVRPIPRVQIGEWRVSDKETQQFRHLLGLRPATVVQAVTAQAEESGLRPGDIIARIGPRVWPETRAVIDEVGRHAGRDVEIRVLRDGHYVTLAAPVSGRGQLGVYLGDAGPGTDAPAIVVRPPGSGADLVETPAPIAPGSRVLAVDGIEVNTWTDLRAALRDATRDAHGAETGASLSLTVRLPLGDEPGSGPVEVVPWTLAPGEVALLHGLGWQSPLDEAVFDPAEITLRAADPLGALVMGVSETHRIVMTTYLTFVRLAQGSVRVEHLKGPVGIADVGSKVFRMGFMNLLFFLAVVSANLAVINFLPLPIVDGGLFVFLLVEGATRRPVSVRVQNAATALGVLLIGAVFLIVTFNDIKNLIAP